MSTTTQHSAPASDDVMQAIEQQQSEGAINLCFGEHPVPVANDNDLLVAIEYVALNHIDAKLAHKGFSQWSYPHIPGMNAVGTVIQAAKGVFPTAGTRVLFNANLADQGMLKQFTTIPNYAVSEVPDAVPNDIAAALPNAGMTALLALEKLRLEDGDTLAINRAHGAVAHFAVQYAKHQGAKVFAFAAKEHHKRLQSLGADVVIDEVDDCATQILKHELGNDGFDCVLNTTGEQTFIDDLQRLRFCGRVACLNGFPTIAQELQFTKAPSIGVVSLGGAWLDNSLCAQQHLRFLGEQLLDDVAGGLIKPLDIKHIPFEPGAIADVMRDLMDKHLEQWPVVKIPH